MSVARRGQFTDRTGNADITLEADTAGVQDGDTLIAFVVWDNNTLTLVPDQSGWTSILTVTTFGTRRMAVWARVWHTGDAVDYSFRTGTTVGGKIGTLLAVSGGRAPAEWVLGAVGTRAASGGTFTTTAPSVTTTVDGSYALLLVGEATSAAETISPTVSVGTLWVTTNPGVETGTEALVVADRTLGAAGASGPASATFQNTHATNSAAIQIAIPPVPVVAPPRVAVAWQSPTGIVEGDLAVVTGSGPEMVTDYRFVQPGYATVDTMLLEGPFYVGHRGGSANWAEMSMHAYTQCALAGVGAFEVSLQRTVDGVWFGLHDPDLNRTADTTGLPNVNTMTWAAVQAYGNYSQVDTSTAPQTYLELTDLLDVYGDSHVMFIDPKNAASFRNELLDIMDIYGGPDRFVAKFHYSGTTWGNAAIARGYQTWGYYYEADLGNVASTHTAWTMLGMEIVASEATFAALEAYGKPVIAHSVATTDQRNKALTLGVDGMIVQNVKMLGVL